MSYDILPIVPRAKRAQLQQAVSFDLGLRAGIKLRQFTPSFPSDSRCVRVEGGDVARKWCVCVCQKEFIRRKAVRTSRRRLVPLLCLVFIPGHNPAQKLKALK